jgi:hypothetical protein
MRLGGTEDGQARGHGTAGLTSTDADLRRKYWVAMGLYAGLALAAWFWIGEGTALVMGRPVDVRLIPEIILGGFALKTWLARRADLIRREQDGNGKTR